MMRRDDNPQVDYSVNGALRISDAVVRRRGAAIELTGQDVSSWLYKVSSSVSGVSSHR